MTIIRKHFYQAMQRGWSVIPLKAGEKTPALPSWKEFQTERADVALVDKWLAMWPDCNIGIVTGLVSGLIVLDVDGPEGKASLHALGVPLLFRQYKVTTPRGFHLYFQHPGEGVEMGNRAGMMPGLDLRGDGGYVVGRGSVVDGVMYE